MFSLEISSLSRQLWFGQSWTCTVYSSTHALCCVVSPQGLIFVVDSNDRERVAESAEELSKIVRFAVNVRELSDVLLNSVP